MLVLDVLQYVPFFMLLTKKLRDIPGNGCCHVLYTCVALRAPVLHVQQRSRQQQRVRKVHDLIRVQYGQVDQSKDKSKWMKITLKYHRIVPAMSTSIVVQQYLLLIPVPGSLDTSQMQRNASYDTSTTAAGRTGTCASHQYTSEN